MGYIPEGRFGFDGRWNVLVAQIGVWAQWRGTSRCRPRPESAFLPHPAPLPPPGLGGRSRSQRSGTPPERPYLAKIVRRADEAPFCPHVIESSQEVVDMAKPEAG